MNTDASFMVDKVFVDRLHFPYGFARSGEFTKKQSALLERHGYAYLGLCSGERAAANDEEKDFIRVFNNEKPAETEHEKVWQIYQRHLTKKQHYISMGRDDRANSTAAEEPIEMEG